MIKYTIEVYEGDYPPEYKYIAVFEGYDGATDSDDVVGTGDTHAQAIENLLEMSYLEDEKK